MSSIDVKARLQLANALEEFLVGKISNFEFEKRIPSSDDGIISAIELSIWHYYDDFKEHVLNNDSVSESERTRICRWILFLRTEEEYRWPPFQSPGEQPIAYGFFWKWILKLDEKQKHFMEYGDYTVWPFLDRETYLKYAGKLR